MSKVKFKYLHRNISRHGTERWYFRKPGQTMIRLPSPHDPKFLAEYHAALNGETVSAPEIVAPEKVVKNSFRDLWVQYASSPEYQSLSAATKDQRRRVMETILQEPLAEGRKETFAVAPVREITPRIIRILRDRKAATPEAANHRLKVLSGLFSWGCEVELVETNPVRDIKKLKSKSEGHHTWSIDEVSKYLNVHGSGSKARLAIGLLLFFGIRISDLARIGPQNVKDGILEFQPYKGRDNYPKTLTLPVLPLARVIIGESVIGTKTFMVTDFGKPFSIKGMGQWFKKRCVEAGLDHCSAHGLRKAGATIAAENGATEEQIRAIYGWENAKEANLYTRKARQKVIAAGAMQLLDFGEAVSNLIHREPPPSGGGTNKAKS